MDKSEALGSAKGVNNPNAIKAKVIVLGEPKTGKSQLIQNLDTSHQQQKEADVEPSKEKDGVFSVLEFSSQELENSTDVYLKTWEYYVGISVQEEELACRGALFCIITLNICDSNTANEAFNKWLALKEEYMAESFLFVVGTHLDESLHRTIQIKDICQACAENDATYVELSNVDNTNVELLRRLIKQRILYMLKMRDVISQENDIANISNNVVNHYVSEKPQPLSSEYTEEGKSVDLNGAPRPPVPPPPPRPGTISIPPLEQNILCNSVGAIMSSYLGAECWPGFEAEEERLVALGAEMSSFVELLAKETGGEFSEESDEQRAVALINSMTVDESLYEFDSFQPSNGNKLAVKSSSKGSGASSEDAGLNPADLYVDAGYSFAELKNAFEVMGLSLPKSLSLVSAAVQESGAYLVDDPSSGEVDGDQTGTPRRKGMSYLRKMMVRLPDGSSADMVLDLESNIEQQIELFLLSNSMAEDQHARDKLVQTIYHIREEYYIANSMQQPPTHRPLSVEGGGVESPSWKGSSPLHDGESSVVHLGSSGSKTNLSDALSKELSSQHSPAPATASRHNADADAHSHTSSSIHSSRVSRSMSIVSVGGPTQSLRPFSKYKATKKCKLRIVVPGSAAGHIEVVLQLGDDLADAAESIRSKHRLSPEMRQKVYEQLIQAFHSG